MLALNVAGAASRCWCWLRRCWCWFALARVATSSRPPAKPSPAAGADTLGEPLVQDLLERDGLGSVQLRVRARAGLPVGPPTAEGGGVPEPGSLQMVVGDLADQLRSQCLEGQIPSGA